MASMFVSPRNFLSGTSCAIAIVMADISVMISPFMCNMGTLPFGLRCRASVGKPLKKLMALVENGSPNSINRAYAAVAQDPGDMKSCNSGVAMVVGE